MKVDIGNDDDEWREREREREREFFWSLITAYQKTERRKKEKKK